MFQRHREILLDSSVEIGLDVGKESRNAPGIAVDTVVDGVVETDTVNPEGIDPV
jgi:hypothetical protein